MQETSQNTAKKQAHGPVELDRIRAAAEPIVSAYGAELVNVELKTEQGGWVLRVTIEKAGSLASKATTQAAAVDLEVCADISRELSPALDVMDAIPQRYSLEVGTPGLERDLHTPAEFARFVGQKAKLRVTVPQRGQSVVVGEIAEGTNETHVALQDGGASYQIPFAEIAHANLVFELTPAQKPGGGSKKQKKNKK
ncbi:MAG TPA: ribosome maturation factor RimP [Polyangiaceae bacterium]